MFRFLVRLENRQDGKYTSKDVLTVLIKLRKSVDEFGAVVKNLRITERALEFDLYVPDESSKERSLEKLSRDFGNILNEKEITQERGAQKEPTLFQSKEETIKLGVELFNEQRFWECHETIEEIWRREVDRAEKEVQQGFILAASALVHHQRNEDNVCLGMIPRALAKLESWAEPSYYSLNVNLLKDRLKRILESKKIEPFLL